MSITALIAPQLPLLRRYARALSGSQASGDSHVVAMLEQLVAVFLLRRQGIAIALKIAIKRAIWRDQCLFELGNGVGNVFAGEAVSIDAPEIGLQQGVLIQFSDDFIPGLRGHLDRVHWRATGLSL